MTGPAFDFSLYLAQQRRRSIHTVRAYRTTAERFVLFLTEHWGTPVDRAVLARVEAADIRAYLARRRGVGVEESGLTNASAARELSAVRAFLEWANGVGTAPMLKGPRVKKGLPRPVATAEAVSLASDVAEESDEPWVAARDWAVLLLPETRGRDIHVDTATRG